MLTRVIPILTIQNGGLVKSVKFKNHKYVGDPINAVKIFNEKEVDELAVLDINATAQKREPNLIAIKEIASEAFMPVAYGGGITTLDQVKEILFNGIEKVIINTAAAYNPQLITSIANQFGSQSIVVCIDYKKTMLSGKKVFISNGTANIGKTVVQFAKEMEAAGAGELLINNIDNDGTYNGYDTAILSEVANIVSIPIVASGGAGTINDFVIAKNCGASAVAAASMFVLQRPHQAVLISYPTQEELIQKLFT